MFSPKSVIFVTMLTVFSVRVHCTNNQIDLDEIRSKVPDGLIPDSLKNVTIPVDELKTVFQEKCKKVSGDDSKYKAVEDGVTHFMNCTSGLVDYEELQNEIEAAQPNGELDTVFHKYCARREIAIGCLENFTAIIEPCLEPQEIEGKKTFVKIFKNLLNFVCFKDGDQIALFIAEKGPECFNDRKDDLITCMNGTFYKHLPSQKEIENKGIPQALPALVMGAEQCNEMDKLQQCVVGALEKCTESTPANLVESMFKFVRNETPCVNITSKLTKKTSTNGAQTLLTSSIFTIVTFLTIQVGLL